MKAAHAILSVSVAVFAAANVCEATVIAVHDGGVPVPDLPGYIGYTISLVSDTADDPAGFDGAFHGPLNQIMAFGALPTPTLDYAGLISPPFGLPEQDSHFLLYGSDILSVTAPNETDLYLGGAFAIFAEARSNPLPLAYLVVRDGDSVYVTGQAADASGNVFPVDWPPPHPPYPPVADADGPYTIDVGETLTLDASGSYDLDGDIISYMWDLDDDGGFETDAGGQAVFPVSYAHLESLGLGLGDPYDIRVEVGDSMALDDVAGTTLTIVPEPATLALLAAGGLGLLLKRKRSRRR